MKKRVGICALVMSLVLGGCGGSGRGQGAGSLHRYEASFLDLFDTVTTIVGYAEDKDNFQQMAQEIHDELLDYHRLFDIYHEYEGINNLKTVNDHAGGEAVEVDGRIIELLEFCRELWETTEGKVDVTMGSVLSLWYQAREIGIDDPENAALPDPEALREAAHHVGFDLLEIDREGSSVRLTDPQARLDVGAVAKGYAVEQVCRTAPTGLLVSVGGNVRATGPRPTDGSAWIVGIQDPDGGEEDYLHTLYVEASSVVSSGDYQRYFTVDGVRCHHLIDPESLYPANLWRAVTVVCPDSAWADGLSTALFLLPQEEGRALLERFGAEAMWVEIDGERYYSSGFLEWLRT